MCFVAAQAFAARSNLSLLNENAWLTGVGVKASVLANRLGWRVVS